MTATPSSPQPLPHPPAAQPYTETTETDDAEPLAPAGSADDVRADLNESTSDSEDWRWQSIR